MEAVINPTWVLLQRLEFLQGIEQIARLCNWADKDIQMLKDHLWDELIKIDNLLYETFEETLDRRIAYLTWESQMEDLRRWLSLMIGVRIRYL